MEASLSSVINVGVDVHHFYDKSMDFEDAIAAIGQEAAAHE